MGSTEQATWNESATSNEETSLLGPKALILPASTGTYGSFVAYCFGVNYILGVGVLSLPYAFMRGGLLLGPLFLLAVTLVAIMVVNWILESMARADAYNEYVVKSRVKQAEEVQGATTGGDQAEQEKDTIDKDTVYYENPTPNDAVNSKSSEIDTKRHQETRDSSLQFTISMKKYELNELCGLFMGRIGKFCYELSVVLVLYGSLWGYASVFAQSAAAYVPAPIGFLSHGGVNGTDTSNLWHTCDVYSDNSFICLANYVLYVLLFSLVAVPLTCLNLTEQKLFQVALAMFRFGALGLMLALTIYAVFFDPYSTYSTNYAPKDVDFSKLKPPYLNMEGIRTVDPGGIYRLLPVCVFSQILHHSIPGLSQPVVNKKNLSRIWTSVLLTTFSIYCSLGVILTLYYGNHLYPACSLNFAFYRGGSSFKEDKPWWAYPLTYVIVLFPAIDVLSSFPLNGIVLGNSLHAMVFTGNDKWMNSRLVQICFRFAAAIPPIIGALFVKDLGVILSYVGLLCLVMTFIMPPILQVVSQYKCQKVFGKSNTHYTMPLWLSSWPSIVVVVILSILIILFCFVFNILEMALGWK